MKLWSPALATSDEAKLAFIDLYDELVARRNLSGSSFAFQSAHFNKLFLLPEVSLFGVFGNGVWGSMACAVRCNDELHLLHIVNSSEGLRTNSSYVLMQYLLEYCLAQDITLFLGGVPEGDDGGVLRFKERWTNSTRPSWLMRLILQPDIYSDLMIPENKFFPAYRKNW